MVEESQAVTDSSCIRGGWEVMMVSLKIIEILPASKHQKVLKRRTEEFPALKESCLSILLEMPKWVPVCVYVCERVWA